MVTRKGWAGYRINGLRLGGLSYTQKRGYVLHIASWHNPAHMCWLWFIEISMSCADEKRALRFYRMPGAQARSVIQLWSINIQFVWQAEGRYKAQRA